MNRQRLDIESLRDSVLAVSGQLDNKLGGVPFGLTASPSVPRRTVYGYIERGKIPGMLAAFDFATPDQHAPLRYTTTVPQQALFLLNSSFLAEQAKHLVERPELAAEKEPAHRVALLYRLVLGRDATAREIEAGTRFLSSETDPATTATEQSAWQYGSGEYDRVTDRTMSFSPFKAFTGDFWQGSSMLPDAVSGKAKLGAEAGEPGDTPQQAVIRRWTSAVEGKLAIEITLRHDQNSLGNSGDGVRARIVSSRQGEVASWTVNGSRVEAKLTGIEVAKGDTLDFVVDSRKDTENDGFRWSSIIKVASSKENGPKEITWSSKDEFRGPPAQPLGVWERYARVLLQMNEFAFVD